MLGYGHVADVMQERRRPHRLDLGVAEAGRFKADPNYYANFRANVEKATKADLKRAAERLLQADSATVLVVGKKSDLLNPDPKHPIPYPSLTGGKLTDVPLRDPMTMKPLAAPSPAK